MNNEKIKPMTIFHSIWYFLISSLLIYIGLYVIIPILLSKDVPFLVGYLIFLYIPHILLFVTSLFLYRKEGNSWNITDFKSRMQLNPMKKADWFFVIGLIFFYLITSWLLTPVSNWLAKIPFFSPPDFFPAEINPNKVRIPGFAFDYKLSGEYWVFIAYFAGWFFNIFGEELLWRGIILPRQVKQYSSKAWIYHGIIWCIWHFYWKWSFITLLPFTLALSYVVYKRKNTWIGIIAHGFLNAIPPVIALIEIIK